MSNPTSLSTPRPMTPRDIIDVFMTELWNQNRLDRADDLFPADFVAKPISYQAVWAGSGPESMKHHIQEWRMGIPDLQMTPVEVVAEGNRVAVSWEMSGTHTGVLYGLPATGRSITAQGATFFETKQGQICELRTAFDALGLLQQLGVLPDAGSIIQSYLSRQPQP